MVKIGVMFENYKLTLILRVMIVYVTGINNQVLSWETGY